MIRLRSGLTTARSIGHIQTAQRPRSLVSMHASEPPQICVFAPTDHELRAAEQRCAGSSSASSFLETPGDPPTQHHLSFHTTAAPSDERCGTFDPSRYFVALETSCLGRTLFTAATTASTQTLIQNNGAKLPEGTVFVTDRQAGGKGRGGNAWESPPGCLMFSTSARLAVSGQRLPFVQYLVTLAVVQAAQAEAASAVCAALRSSSGSGLDSAGTALQNKEDFSIDLRIKWPNDVYAKGMKLGGILCHSFYREGQFQVTIGVGLNLANRQPTTCIDALAEAAAAAAGAPAPPPPVQREVLLAGIMTRLEPMLARLAEAGFAPFEREYYSAWLHSGQEVRLEEEGRQVCVVVRGLSPHGYLMAEDEAGRRYELHPDGNSFDFFNGLVRKKL